MAKNDLIPVSRCVVIGGSAGSLKALMRILPGLKPAKDVAIIIILHRKNDSRSSLDQLLGYQTRLEVKEAEDKETMRTGVIYIAPPDYHLLIENDASLSLDCSEKILWSRPSIDVTFESAAEIFGAGTLGVLLSGANNDGTQGLASIRQAGGHTLVQDPANAEIPAMPQSALNDMQPDFVLPDTEIAGAINRF